MSESGEQRRGTVFYRGKGEFRGAVVNKESIGVNWKFELFIGSVVAGEEKILLPAGVPSRVENCFPAGERKYISWGDWRCVVGVRGPSTGLPKSNVNEVSVD